MNIFVTATRGTKSDFAHRPLGRSFQRMSSDSTLRLAVVENNRQGLSKVFNRFITEDIRGHNVVFVHDDLWLDDMFLSDRIRAALEMFDVVGVAGNQRLVSGAPAWHVKNDEMEWDTEFLSGIVSHGAGPFGAPSVYGPTPAPVQLLDGVLIAARVSALLDAGVRFDERFDYHFYDLDFSRQANLAKLSVGTWPIAVTHTSPGAFGTSGWQEGLKLYRDKWGAIAEGDSQQTCR
jgi:GT2 family glycosyltransferase